MIAGFGGTLFPTRYLADGLQADARRCGIDGGLANVRADRLARWWQRVADTCGPATSTRALFDAVAMPLFGMLGYRARPVRFDGPEAEVCLETGRGTPVGLVVRPWSSRPSARTRQGIALARLVGSHWCFVLAPPFLSLLDARGHATRRAIDIALPQAVSPSGLATFVTLAHNEAFDPASPGARLATIDVLVAQGAAFQDRVRRDLHMGVETALSSLRSVLPVDRRRTSADDEALTLVYRVLFLLFAESRDMVPHAHPIYARAYAMGGLCCEAMAGEVAGSWEALAATTRLARVGCRAAGLDAAAFNGPLFARHNAPCLERTGAAMRSRRRMVGLDRAAHQALIALGSRRGPAGRETLSFRDLGVEQLGAIYEQVLDVDHGHPPPRTNRKRGQAHAVARKETGTFYTPQPLTEYVVRRTLGPLVSGTDADGILRLRVIDPAMGSGAFLVASCHYLAHAYERALIDEGRASATDFDDNERASVRRTIAERCLAGVDRNVTAVHLARLSLWLTTLARGKPLTFLDHRLRVGNSLVGGWPADLRRSTTASHAAHDLPLFEAADLEETMRACSLPLGTLSARPNDTVRDVRAKEALWRQLSGDQSVLAPWRTSLTLWCARWFWPTGAEPPPNAAEMRALVAHVLTGDRSLPSSRVTTRLQQAADVGRAQAFFHWPLEFPDVFYDADGRPRGRAGFDAVVGNPPWEMLRDDASAGGAGAALRRGAAGRRDNRQLTRFVRESAAYPSCAHGHMNLYQPFIDRALALTRTGGRIGLVLPWGLASDDGATLLRRRLFETTAIDAIAGLDNRDRMFAIHRGVRFMALTTTVGKPTREVRAAFGIRNRDEIDALPEPGVHTAAAFPIILTPEQIELVSGPRRRIPDIRHVSHLAWMERLGRSMPRLGAANGWGVHFGRELNATEVRPHLGDKGLPVIEGKHLTPFVVSPSSAIDRLDRTAATRFLPNLPFAHHRLAYRDVSAVTNRTTLVAAIVPPEVLTTHTLLCLKEHLALERLYFLCGLFNSYVLNAIVRALVGSHVTTTVVEALPVPCWRGTGLQRSIALLSARLVAEQSSDRVARLQALVARLYGISPVEFLEILNSFPLIPRSDRQQALTMI